MTLITLDMETYYDRTYSLSKMTTESYIRDPMFKVHGVGIKVGDKPAKYYPEQEVATIIGLLRGVQNQLGVVCHNTRFDGAILAWHYDFRPAFWFDTLSMARAVFPHESGSLDNLSKLCGLGQKGKELANFLGVRTLTPEQQEVMGAYCRQDVELTYKLFQVLKKDFPVQELKVIDQTIRLFTEPVLEIDTAILEAHLGELKKKKAALLTRWDLTALRSNPQFANLLELFGGALPHTFFGHEDTNQGWLTDWDAVKEYHTQRALRTQGAPVLFDIPTKKSAKTKKQTYAFSKTDEGMLALLDHENENVQLLATARLGVKSSIEETRTEAFLGIAKRGALPVPLNYFGAQNTGRFGGSDGLNLQNLPRGGALRKSIMAPEGHSIVVVDFASIEARMLAWLAGQDDLVDAFAAGVDIYCEFASKVYGRPITKADKKERFLGKLGILGLGYSMSWKKLASLLAIGPLGQAPILFNTDDLAAMHGCVDHSIDPEGITTKLIGYDLLVHCSAAKALVEVYRSSYPQIPKLWRVGETKLAAMARGVRREFGPVYTDQDRLWLPNGLSIQYRDLRRGDSDDNGWIYCGKRGETQYIYGAKQVENEVQALSRIVMTDAMRKIGERYKIVLTVHDEVCIVCKDDRAEEGLAYMLEVMRSPPPWAEGLPLDAEGSASHTYGDAK